MPSPITMGYRRDIDGLRAWAVMAVVLYHAFPTALRGGFVGVDVFFVISGYLITLVLNQALDRGDFTPRRVTQRPSNHSPLIAGFHPAYGKPR